MAVEGTQRGLTEEDFANAALSIGCSVAAIKAICKVEAPRGGFNPDGSPVTLFEGHWFSRLTKGIYDKQFPTVSYPSWTRQHYGKTWEQEQARLELAMALDRNAAMLSASWGRFQIMGFNHGVCNFTTVQAFVQAMKANEGEHLRAFVAYVKHECLDDELRALPDPAAAKAFAYRYNGREYWKNRYDEKIIEAFGLYA